MKFLTNKAHPLTLAGVILGLSLAAPMTAHSQDKSASEIRNALERQRVILGDGGRGSALCTGGDCADRGIQIFDDESQSTSSAPEKVITKAPAASSGSSSSGTVVRAEPSKPKKSTGYKANRPRVTPVALPQLPDGERLDLVILFEFDSAFIRPASRPQLQALCEAIAGMQATDKFAIIGHTDASGNAQYNFNLSQRRAKEVRRHLISECGVSGDRLEAFGLGEERLLEGIAGRSEQQRRVEIQLNVSS